MSLWKLSFAAALAALLSTPARAAVLDPSFVESEYVASNDIIQVTAMAWAPDGSNRLFITKEMGDLLLVKNGQLMPTPVVTVSPLYGLSECGLLGLAFDPNFLANHYLYLFVTVSSSEQQIIRYTLVGDTVTEKTVVVAGLPTRGANHDGGGLGFGPDGKLYWSIGDNGAGVGVNADLTSLAAKVGRANRDGTAPLDNPFHDGSGARDLIWARGMRNPFTLTFQPTTGLLWLNVVGDAHEQVFIVRKGDHGGYNMQEANQTPPNIRPVIKYHTNGSDIINLRPVAMNGAVRASGVVTFRSLTPHQLLVGEKVTVTNVVDSSFNGSFFVATVPDETSFTVAQAGPDTTSGSAASPLATATTSNFGGCVTGGAFYDSSQAPAAYRGNFFFGDYNNIGGMPGRVMRAAIDPATNAVTAVDLFATDVPGQVDVALGPDGALYWVGNGSRKVVRGAWKATAQGLVVSPLNLWTAERESVVVNVSLAMAPAAAVTVSVARSDGDADVTVSAGATLTFTPANWNVPQIATISAAADADVTDDQASITVTATGLPPETVTVHAHDLALAGPDAGVTPDAAAVDAAPEAAVAADARAGDDLGGDSAIAPDAGPDAARDAAPADAAATGGTGGTGGATGGSGGTTGATGGASGTSAGGGGCSCQTGGPGRGGSAGVLILLGAILLRRRYRRPQERLLK
jgi:MYXO-CTERM domain-containing protein